MFFLKLVTILVMLRANFPSLYKGGSSMKYGKSKMVKPKVKKIKSFQKKKKGWLRRMENTKDVEIHVTGISMFGKAEIKNEHSGTTQEDKEKTEGTEIGNSREDD